jgi:hypothetical protein
MKAIEINGEIKTFGSVPKRWSDENGLHLNIGDGSAFGFKDVVTPTFDGRIEKLENLHLDGDVYTYDVVDITFPQTLAELKADKIQSLKSIIGNKLSATDWYVIRNADVGTEIPADIKESRADLRDQSDILEAEINALTTKKAVVLFDINL